MTKTFGLLVMAFGTPSNSEEIEAYYTRIRRGKAPSSEQLSELTERFAQIGGLSPLIQNTEAQAAELHQQVKTLDNNVDFKLYVAYQYVSPFISDVVRQMYEDGIREVVAVTLAPHYSKFSVQGYHDLAHQAAQNLEGMHFTDIFEWWREPGFAKCWAQKIETELLGIPDDEQDKTLVIFSAHSLPEKTLAAGDLYAEQVSESAEEIAKAAQLGHYAKVWQSAGRTGDVWLSPDVRDITRDLVTEKGYLHVIYCPIGFTTEHLEVLYDNDIECREVCDELGVAYHRPAMPTANPVYISSISKAIAKKLGL